MSPGAFVDIGKKFLPNIMAIPDNIRIDVAINPSIDKNLVQGRVDRKVSLIWLRMALSVSRFEYPSELDTVRASDDTIYCPP
jgi:hypothetical protein